MRTKCFDKQKPDLLGAAHETEVGHWMLESLLPLPLRHPEVVLLLLQRRVHLVLVVLLGLLVLVALLLDGLELPGGDQEPEKVMETHRLDQ